jgi:Family of unknown function (DUF6093)
VSVAGALARGRDRHTALMVEGGELCTIARPAGRVLAPGTDQLVDTLDPVYGFDPPDSGICRMKAFRTGHPVTAGQVAVMQRGYDVNLPWDATGQVNRGDVLTMTASDDPWVLGRPMTIIEVNYSGTQTARHVMVEDLS